MIGELLRASAAGIVGQWRSSLAEGRIKCVSPMANGLTI